MVPKKQQPTPTLTTTTETTAKATVGISRNKKQSQLGITVPQQTTTKASISNTAHRIRTVFAATALSINQLSAALRDVKTHYPK